MVAWMPLQVKVRWEHAPVVTMLSPSIFFAPAPSCVIMMRLAAHVLHAEKKCSQDHI